jgi:hypothetical protein
MMGSASSDDAGTIEGKLRTQPTLPLESGSVDEPPRPNDERQIRDDRDKGDRDGDPVPRLHSTTVPFG